jgi:hypothetical protein
MGKKLVEWTHIPQDTRFVQEVTQFVIMDGFCGHSNVLSGSIKADNFFNNSPKKVVDNYTANIFTTATRKILQKWMNLDTRTRCYDGFLKLRRERANWIQFVQDRSNDRLFPNAMSLFIPSSSSSSTQSMFGPS